MSTFRDTRISVLESRGLGERLIRWKFYSLTPSLIQSETTYAKSAQTLADKKVEDRRLGARLHCAIH